MAKRWALALVIAASMASSVGAPAAVADVFHGYWIRGTIEDKFHELGGAAALGDAVMDEASAADGGRYQKFARGSSIYWHPDVGGGEAFQVGGLIFERWGASNWEHGPLGFPRTDEETTPDGQGRYNHFQNGSIYWHPDTGAHSVSGGIRSFWASRDWEQGYLGYPVSEAYEFDGGIRQEFQGGAVHFLGATDRQLERSDNRPHSSYRVTYPLIEVDDESRWSAAGAAQAISRDFSKYFPYLGCPDRIFEGAECTVSTVGGFRERLRVDKLSDTGIGMTTLEGSPQGENRVMNFSFEVVGGPGERNDDDVYFGGEVDLPIQLLYRTSDKPWLRMTVESFGPIKDALWAGPMNSQRMGEQVWNLMARNIRLHLENTPDTYIVGAGDGSVVLEPHAPARAMHAPLELNWMAPESEDSLREDAIVLEEFTAEERKLLRLNTPAFSTETEDPAPNTSGETVESRTREGQEVQ